MIFSQATKNLKIIYFTSSTWWVLKNLVTPLFSGKIRCINILNILQENVCLFKLNKSITGTNLLEQSPDILTTNFRYKYYFHKGKLKEKPTIKHAASLTLSSLMMIFRMEREPEPSSFGHLHQNYYSNG